MKGDIDDKNGTKYYDDNENDWEEYKDDGDDYDDDDNKYESIVTPIDHTLTNNGKATKKLEQNNNEHKYQN